MHKGIIHLKRHRIHKNAHTPTLQIISANRTVPVPRSSTYRPFAETREIQLTMYVPELAEEFLHFGGAKFYNTLLNNQ
jgi:hypothetical protein